MAAIGNLAADPPSIALAVPDPFIAEMNAAAQAALQPVVSFPAQDPGSVASSASETLLFAGGLALSETPLVPLSVLDTGGEAAGRPSGRRSGGDRVAGGRCR